MATAALACRPQGNRERPARVVSAGSGWADMFVLPGQRLQVTSALVTNFDLPRSTPLTLTCVFAGRDPVLRAHREAMEQRHRLYRSDAMLIV